MSFRLEEMTTEDKLKAMEICGMTFVGIYQISYHLHDMKIF
jgi:hypothetical protein